MLIQHGECESQWKMLLRVDRSNWGGIFILSSLDEKPRIDRGGDRQKPTTDAHLSEVLRNKGKQAPNN
jgi:hypothetical protein